MPATSLAIALAANPAADWFFRHKCPEIVPWLDRISASHCIALRDDEIRAAEVEVLEAVNDWLVYAINPSMCDALPFAHWPSDELTALVTLRDKIILDAGAA